MNLLKLHLSFEANRQKWKNNNNDNFTFIRWLNYRHLTIAYSSSLSLTYNIYTHSSLTKKCFNRSNRYIINATASGRWLLSYCTFVYEFILSVECFSFYGRTLAVNLCVISRLYAFNIKHTLPSSHIEPLFNFFLRHSPGFLSFILFLFCMLLQVNYDSWATTSYYEHT